MRLLFVILFSIVLSANCFANDIVKVSTSIVVCKADYKSIIFTQLYDKNDNRVEGDFKVEVLLLKDHKLIEKMSCSQTKSDFKTDNSSKTPLAYCIVNNIYKKVVDEQGNLLTNLDVVTIHKTGGKEFYRYSQINMFDNNSEKTIQDILKTIR